MTEDDALAAKGAPSDKDQARKPLIKLDKLSKHYGNHTVLDGIDLEVMPGEVLAIIGPSGSGKSTLLRCINYLEPPDGGHVTIGDISLNAAAAAGRSELSTLRRSVGMVFQSFNLFPHMTVLRNVSLAQERVLGAAAKTPTIGRCSC